MTVMPSLPELLRAATHDLHCRAERAGVMAKLLRGQLERPRYVALLRNLHGVYAALEARELPVASLARTEALHSDLETLHGPGWAEAHPLAPATAVYVSRLHEAPAAALAAHAYVRYLGDLHGGQTLARLVREAYGLGSGAGTSFYEFGDEAQLAARRIGLRAALAGLPLDADGLETATAEARWAFEQHIRLFNELVEVVEA